MSNTDSDPGRDSLLLQSSSDSNGDDSGGEDVHEWRFPKEHKSRNEKPKRKPCYADLEKRHKELEYEKGILEQQAKGRQKWNIEGKCPPRRAFPFHPEIEELEDEKIIVLGNTEFDVLILNQQYEWQKSERYKTEPHSFKLDLSEKLNDENVQNCRAALMMPGLQNERVLAANLKELCLAGTKGNKITDSGFHLLAAVFEQMHSLEILQLDNNEITGTGFFRSKGKLYHIWRRPWLVKSRRCEGRLICKQCLPKNLKELSLSQNKIADEGSNFVVDALIGLEHLEKLNVGKNKITDLGLEYLTAMLQEEYFFLKELYLNGNTKITNVGFEYLVNKLAKHKYKDPGSMNIHDKHPGRDLTILDVRNNGIQGYIPSALSTLTNLKKICIKGNELKAPEMVDMYANIYQTPSQQLKAICNRLVNKNYDENPFAYVPVYVPQSLQLVSKLFGLFLKCIGKNIKTDVNGGYYPDFSEHVSDQLINGELHLNMYRWLVLLTIVVFVCFGFLTSLYAPPAPPENVNTTENTIYLHIKEKCVKVPLGFDQAYFGVWSLFILSVAVCGGSVLALCELWRPFVFLFKLVKGKINNARTSLKTQLDEDDEADDEATRIQKDMQKCKKAAENVKKKLLLTFEEKEFWSAEVAELSQKESWFERFDLLQEEEEAEHVDVAGSNVLFAVAVVLGWITVFEYSQQLWTGGIEGRASCKVLYLAAMPLYKPLQAPMFTVVLSLINHFFGNRTCNRIKGGKKVTMKLPPQMHKEVKHLPESSNTHLAEQLSKWTFFRAQHIRVRFTGKGRNRHIVLIDKTEPPPYHVRATIASILYLPLAMLLGWRQLVYFFPIFFGVMPILLYPLFIVWIVVQLKAQWKLRRFRNKGSNKRQRPGKHEQAVKCTGDAIASGIGLSNLLDVMNDGNTMADIKAFMIGAPDADNDTNFMDKSQKKRYLLKSKPEKMLQQYSLYLSKVLVYLLLVTTVYITVLFWSYFEDDTSLSWSDAIGKEVSTVQMPDFRIPPWQWPQLSLPNLLMFDFEWPTRLLFYSGLGVVLVDTTFKFCRAVFYATFPEMYGVYIPRERARAIAMRFTRDIDLAALFSNSMFMIKQYEEDEDEEYEDEEEDDEDSKLLEQSGGRKEDPKANEEEEEENGDRDGYDRDGYDRDGYDRDGYNRDGYNRNGIHRGTGTQYNRDGYDRDGYDRGTGTQYNRDGYNRHGYDREEEENEEEEENRQQSTPQSTSQHYLNPAQAHVEVTSANRILV